MASFTRRLAELIDADLPLASALRLAGRSSGSTALRYAAEELARHSEQEASQLPKAALRLPAGVVSALESAGATGKPNIRLLQELAEIYAERVRDRFDWSTGLLAPMSIALVGLVVGAVVVALLLPLVSLVSGLT